MIIVFLLLLDGASLINAQGTCSRKERVVPEGLKEPAQTDGPPLKCDVDKIDAATRTMDGTTYFFKDAYYWDVDGTDVGWGYPRLIAQDWKGGPASVDAALNWFDGRTLLFKDDKYWSFTERTLDAGYPRNITDGFCGVSSNIDAAILYPGNKVYFFKGASYWRFLLELPCNPATKSYPAKIKDGWKGMPDSPDDIVQGSDNKFYFIKSGNYFIYSEHADDPDGGKSAKLETKFGLPCNTIACRVNAN